MQFQEPTSPWDFTKEQPPNFYLRDKRIKFPQRKDIQISEGRSSSQSSIFKSNEDSSHERSLERTDSIKDSIIEKPLPVYIHGKVQAEGKLKCTCNICRAQNLIKPEIEPVVVDPFFAGMEGKVRIVNLEIGFIFVLKRLMPSKQIPQSLSLNIPESLVFIDGECKFYVMVGKDKTLKYVNKRAKFALHEVKRFFSDCFERKELEQKECENKVFREMDNHNNPTEYNIESRRGIELRRGPTLPGFHTERNSKKREARSLENQSSIKNSKEVALLKFNDDSTTVLCLGEFENLITKKRFDPYWRKVAFIQNYAGIAKHIHTLQKSYFLYEREKFHPLFERASIETKLLNGTITPSSENYISPYAEEIFQQNLKFESESDYTLYILMKIFHFLQLVHRIRIVKMCGDFVRDSLGVLWLTNISHFQYETSEPESIKDENINSVLNLDETEEDEGSLSPDFPESREKRAKAVDVLSDILHKKYEEMKDRIGITKPAIAYQEDISDNIFSKLYPKAPVKLSTILKANTQQPGIAKKILQDNSLKGMLPTNNRPSVPSEPEKQQGPVKGIYLSRFNEHPPPVGPISSVNSVVSGSHTNRSHVKSRLLKLQDHTANTSRSGKTLLSLGNIDEVSVNYLNKPPVGLPKLPIQTKENNNVGSSRASSQPSGRKSFKINGMSPTLNTLLKSVSETLKENGKRILKKSAVDLLPDKKLGGKSNNNNDGSCCTERQTPNLDLQKSGFDANTPYVTGLKGAGRELQDKQSTFKLNLRPKRSQSVNRRSLGFILSARQPSDA